jgi:hypothetical protein
MFNAQLPFLVLAASVAAVSMSGAQEAPRIRWSLAGGPSFSFGQGRPIVTRSNSFVATSADTVVLATSSAKYHVTLGASRELRGSALVARGELFYNRSLGSPAGAGQFYGLTTRQALREDVYGLNVGFQWDALPSKAFSPYLLTTAGVMHSRVGWSRDSSSRRVDTTSPSWGPTLAAGMGLRLRVAHREFFTEWRRYYRWHTLTGTTFVPVSFGIRF